MNSNRNGLSNSMIDGSESMILNIHSRDVSAIINSTINCPVNMNSECHIIADDSKNAFQFTTINARNTDILNSMFTPYTYFFYIVRHKLKTVSGDGYQAFFNVFINAPNAGKVNIECISEDSCNELHIYMVYACTYIQILLLKYINIV